MAERSLPHLTDTESVRQEAAQQYGGLSDAAAFLQSSKSRRDANVEAAALRRVNVAETEKVQDDLEGVQKKIDKEYGEGYTVLDAAVRGDALSVVAEDPAGRVVHLVVGHTSKWRSITPTPAEAAESAHAKAEADRGRLGAEARAEVQRLVAEATAEIMAEVKKRFSGEHEKVVKAETEAIKEAGEADEASGSGSTTPGASRKTRSRSKSKSRSKG